MSMVFHDLTLPLFTFLILSLLFFSISNSCKVVYSIIQMLSFPFCAENFSKKNLGSKACKNVATLCVCIFNLNMSGIHLLVSTFFLSCILTIRMQIIFFYLWKLSSFTWPFRLAVVCLLVVHIWNICLVGILFEFVCLPFVAEYNLRVNGT